MIRIADELASRALRSLSTLLRKPLSLIDGDVRADVPLLDDERAAVHDLMELVRRDGCDERVRELEGRVAQLQHENIELIMKNRVLAEVSARDALTGLYNRWYVMEKIESEMNRSLRHGSPVALMMLDIDHFKRVNDSFGHAAGDSVLKSFGQVLRESCRVYDVPGRYGGEEFCIVLPETRVGNTTAVAERIRQRLAQSRFDVGGGSVAITASMGIAGMEADDGIVTSATLVERADRALYSAKNHGRNRIEVWATGLAAETNH
jgi:diguanylate cyclase (GGDEF)-like protein